MPSWPLDQNRFRIIQEDEETIPSIRKFKKRIGRLNDRRRAKMLADVDGEQCRKFVKERGNKGGSRRDPQDCAQPSIITPLKATTGDRQDHTACKGRAS